MKKNIFLLLLLCLIFTTSSIIAQNRFNVETTDEKEGSSVKIYGNNSFPCQITLVVEFSAIENVCNAETKTILLKPNANH